jgi:hypothetical protein
MPTPARAASLALAWGIAGLAGSLLGCSPSSGAATGAALTRDQMLDPSSCQGCHPHEFLEWARSMHAHASDDPVFVAMNQRGQRETGGTLGDFCVTCHAPMALRDGQTTDGLNLASLPPRYQGVSCFFCHSVESVDGTHNAQVTVAGDLTIRGPLSDPVHTPAHASTYSALHDRDQHASGTMCGACHDIVVRGTNAPIERTFCQWSLSAFGVDPRSGGQTCAQCHMVETSAAVASVPGAPVRAYHAHDFPAVDVELDPNRDNGPPERAAVQQNLAAALQGAVCVTQAAGLRVVVDPVALGHDWPSGAAQDRRAWAEVIAYSGGSVIYQSGVVADGTAVTDSTDPDLWLLRDQMFDGQGQEVHMFWQAVTTTGNEIPALATFDPLDARFYQTHVEQFYPRSRAPLPAMPDRVTFRLRLQPIGLDVLNDLVASGDLDPAIAAAMPTWDVMPLLEWNAQTATLRYQDTDGTPVTCVSTTGFNVSADKTAATSLASCGP